MNRIVSHAGGIVYRERRLSPVIRLFTALVGVGMVLGAGVFVSLGRWLPPRWSDLLALAGILAFLIFACICFAVAASSAKTLEFDAARRVLVWSWRGPLGRSGQDVAFDSIGEISSERIEAEDGAFWIVRIAVAGERLPLQLVEIGEEAEVKAWSRRIEAIVRAEPS